MSAMTFASSDISQSVGVDFDLLQLTMPGRVFTADDSGYDRARAGFSVSHLPHPDVIVAATSAADVVAAVNFARAHALPVGVKATGHGFPFAYQTGMMINTEGLQGLAINPERQTARVEAGVRWAAVIEAAHAYGLAPLNGSSPDVGVVGYTLFGGFGWLLRKYGAAVDSVVGVEIVTADGELRYASETINPDLFWALRGASGNFGVVTAIEFRLYPVSHVYGGALFFPMEQAHAVLTTYSRWAAESPAELSSAVVLMRFPPLPFIPEPLRGRAVITIRGAFAGSEADGVELIAPLRALGNVLIDTFRMMPYNQIATVANDPKEGKPTHRSTMMLRDLSPATIEALLNEIGPDGRHPVTGCEIRQLGGAMTEVDPESTSFSQRYAPYMLQTFAALMGPEQSAVAIANTQAFVEALAPHTTGGVLPSWLADHGVDRMRAGFTPEHYTRLAALKAQYDPANMFRLNHNIPPATH